CRAHKRNEPMTLAFNFYSPDIKLAVELDGDSHYQTGAQNDDRRRDATIQSFGIRILRILNTDVYENLDGVWDAISRPAREQIELLRPSDPPGRRGRLARRA